MLKGFFNAFKTPDLRKKLLFTIGIIVIFRLGSFIPTPGVNYSAVKECTAGDVNDGLMGMINLFSGGALLQLSVFALGIMPYITASIIIQLLRVVIPRFEALNKEGQSGQAKLTQYTRYVTVGLAILQSTTIITTAISGQLFGGKTGACESVITHKDNIMTLVIMIIAMTAGTSLIMWFGELITENGVGNGMSILIFSSICANFLPNLWSIGQTNIMKFVMVVAIVILIITIVTFVENSQRRIPVQYARRQVGSQTLGGQSTYLPIKINMSGVIPIIFASSILAVPGLIAQFGDPNSEVVQWIQTHVSQQQSPVHMTLYALLIIFFCFFYTSITFNVVEVAENMRNQGGFVPGIRAGKPTSNYLRYILHRLNTVGSIYLALIALIPTIVFLVAGLSQSLPFGGTTILIIVGVGLDTVKQINSQLQQHHYDGFLGQR
ncbi:MAG: preprotein translocase subunit SecY [Candidatus Ancillula sp.]|jgi:preprotein translocase subunit SecY|nr:preprotein translocase subunit SecY [Candidatus Ancillula sp.]